MEQNQATINAKNALVMEQLGNAAKNLITKVAMRDIETHFQNDKRILTVQLVPTPMGITTLSGWKALGKEEYKSLLELMVENGKDQGMSDEIQAKFQEIITLLEVEAQQTEV
ncbi:MAG: hypothetical protein ACRCZJ_03700 [Erysipelotrichaceae bacterium]